MLEGQPLREFFVETLRTKVTDAVNNGAPPDEHPTEWDLQAIVDELQLVFPVKDVIDVESLESMDRDPDERTAERNCGRGV